jgi:arsenite methyltransferase
MVAEISLPDRKRIEESIREKYGKVALAPEGLFNYPIGRAGLQALQYNPVILESLPEPIPDSYCGVGNLFALDPINPEERVLDVGCGAGVDILIAANLTGPTGVAVGVDLVPDMLAKAKQNAILADLRNLFWLEASSENLPLAGNTFDVVISNGVFNLVIDKPRALKEVFRVLKPGGRLQLADQILMGEPSADPEDRVESWFK